MNKDPIYLDYCSSTPCDPEVVKAMLPYFSNHYGNPSSKDHFYGWKSNEAVDRAREQVASLIGAVSHQVVFTSGATESINLAIKGLVKSHIKKGRPHLITCVTEHKAVLNTCGFLANEGVDVSYLQVNREGAISLEELESEIRENTLGIILMWGNNETGVLHPLSKVGELARKYGLYFICDATQAIGKVPVDVAELQADLMAFSAHKMYGPKGVGALFVHHAKAMGLTPLLHGGKHENGVRSGTLNVPGIVGFGEAAEICLSRMESEVNQTRQLRELLESGLLKGIPGSKINGWTDRLPHITSLLLPTGNAEDILLALASKLAMSRGSACSGINQEPSHVLLSMGMSREEAYRTIRISVGRFTTESMINQAVEHLSEHMKNELRIRGANSRILQKK